jgi:hypothetical protein
MGSTTEAIHLSSPDAKTSTSSIEDDLANTNSNI